METEKYYKLDPSVEEMFYSTFKKMNNMTSLKFALVGIKKQKQLIKLTKINDLMKIVSEKDFLVTINVDILDLLENAPEKEYNVVEILFYDELNRIHYDMSKDKLELLKPDLLTSLSVLHKFGNNDVVETKELEKLTFQQILDKEKDKKSEEKAKTSKVSKKF